MGDKEIRERILEVLKELYDKEPHDVMDGEELLQKLKISDNELDRNIKYLEQKGLVDVEWFLGGDFIVGINSYGIDMLEKIKQSIEEVGISEYTVHHIFNETKDFVDRELSEMCPDALDKLKLCYEDLLDSNSNKYPRIAFECREILKDFTDAIFKDEYLRDNEIRPTRNQTKNKLKYALRAMKIESETVKEMLDSQVEYLMKYFDNLYSFIQKNAHPERFEVTKEDANKCVIYTYLISGDVLRLLKQNENTGIND